MADTLHATGYNKDALRFYEPLYKHERGELRLRSFLGLYTCYINLGEDDNAQEIVDILKDWNAETLDDLTILAKFFEDIGMQDEATQRAETVYRNRGAHRLRRIGFKGYTNLLQYFFNQRKQARGKDVIRKKRAKKHMKKLMAATRPEQDSENEEDMSELPSLGPLDERPTQGLFRSKKPLSTGGPKTFLPVEPETLEGTNVPIDAIDRRLFRSRLEKLASDYADELKAARAQHREIVASFGRLDELCDAADAADQAAAAEYISISRELIEEYSTFDLFYSNRREDFQGYFRRVGSGDLWKDSALMILAVQANRAEDGEKELELSESPEVVPREFYGIHFDKWADVFGRYALLLARQGEKDRCFSALDVAIQSNIFHRSRTYHHLLELCRLACALAVDDSLQASSAVRWLMRTYPFGTEIFRLYGAVNRLSSFAEGFAMGSTAKALMRYIKTMDYVLLTPEQRVWYNFRGDDRTQWMHNAISSGITDYVKDHDPALFALFAHVLSSSGSYMAALNYYFRAFAITPEDPTLNLSIGMAYLQHSMKRLSENRQFQIQQGLAFINRYYELRTKDSVPIHCSEAEFNVGRVWHSLGLMSNAVASYERCIALSERVQEEASDECRDGDWGVEDFATEAAFAIQAIYAVSGDFEGARKVTETVLVIE